MYSSALDEMIGWDDNGWMYSGLYDMLSLVYSEILWKVFRFVCIY